MKRLTVITIAALALTVAFAVMRRIVRASAPRIEQRMMQDVMPHMMDFCFGRMPPERRAFMLAHCRGQLDRVEATYPRGEAATSAPEHAYVA